MKFVADHAEYEMMSVISAIRRDDASWQGWHCLRVQMPARADMRNLFESHLAEKDGTVFFCAGETAVFCKDISAASLHGLACQTLAVLAAEGIQGNFSVYDIARDAQQLTESYSYEALTRKTVSRQRALRPAAAQKSFARLDNACHVLLVEDDPVTRWLVRSALKDECLLSTVQSVRTAIAAYQSRKPDIVLLDLHDNMDNIVGMLESGARGFIAKPFDKEKLLQYIGRYQALPGNDRKHV